MDAVSPIAIEGLMLELIAETSRFSWPKSEPNAPRWLFRARDLIHARFFDSISLAQIAENVQVHPTHLARSFRKHYLCTIGEYIRRLRIENAIQQLITTELSITQIAINTGFYDQSHFTRAFKQVTNLTPTELRKRSRHH